MIRHMNVLYTLLLIFTLTTVYGQGKDQRLCFEFYQGTFNCGIDSNVLVNVPVQLTPQLVRAFYAEVNAGNYKPLMDSLTAYKQRSNLNDWLYYQLIRKVAQQISPKEVNYSRYTLYKWFLLAKSGYDARLALTSNKVIFYVFNDEKVEDIPFFDVDNRRYVCLNYHDYANADLHVDPPMPVNINIPEAVKAF
jgi:hypothetical protein